MRVTVLGPGIARSIPWFDTLEIRDVQEDSYNLAAQSITTKDDVSVTLGANFMYEIADVRLAVCGVREFASSLQDLAMMHIAERVREWTWDELRDNQRELERSLKDTLTTRAKRWGVHITKCGMTDMVRARQYRLMGELNTG